MFNGSVMRFLVGEEIEQGSIPFFYVEKGFASNLGVIGSHVWSFLFGDRLRRAKIGVPPKKISNFFPEIFCQWIDRKSQEVSSTYIKLFGFDRR